MGLGAAAAIVGAVVLLHASGYRGGKKYRRSGGVSALKYGETASLLAGSFGNRNWLVDKDSSLLIKDDLHSYS